MQKALLLSILLVFGCENVDRDLYDQVSFRTQESPRRLNPVGSTPMFNYKIDYSDVDPATLAPPFPLSAEAANNGKPLYDIYCLVCHGSTGKSDTKVADKMDYRPFGLTEKGTIAMTDGEIFWKILVADSVMPKYRNELSDKEAWEITAYVRKLQEAK